MRIVGMDLSLNHTGVAIRTDATLHTDVLEPSKLGELDRLHWIITQVGELSRGSDLVVLEGFSFASKGNIAYQLGGLGFGVRVWLHKHAIPFQVVAPQAVKKFVTGKAGADKNIVLKELYKRFQIDVDDDNIADACVLVLIGECLLGMREPTTQAQREVLAILRGEKPAKKRKRAA